MINRLNAVLLVILLIFALAQVTIQHQIRRLYSEIEKTQKQSAQLEIEYNKLQIEQGTLGSHVVVEQAAIGRLNMHVPDQHEVVALFSEDGK